MLLLQINNTIIKLMKAYCYQNVDIKISDKKNDELIYERLSIIY